MIEYFILFKPESTVHLCIEILHIGDIIQQHIDS